MRVPRPPLAADDDGDDDEDEDDEDDDDDGDDDDDDDDDAAFVLMLVCLVRHMGGLWGAAWPGFLVSSQALRISCRQPSEAKLSQAKAKLSEDEMS